MTPQSSLRRSGFETNQHICDLKRAFNAPMIGACSPELVRSLLHPWEQDQRK